MGVILISDEPTRVPAEMWQAELKLRGHNVFIRSLAELTLHIAEPLGIEHLVTRKPIPPAKQQHGWYRQFEKKPRH